MKFVKNLIESIIIFSFTGILSLIGLLFLMLTNTYFKKLDFKLEGFAKNIDNYILATSTIPIITTLIFYLVYILKSHKNLHNILISVAILVLGIVLFIKLDNFIKEKLFVFDSAFINLSLCLFSYLLTLFLLVYQQRKLKNYASC